MGIRLCFSNMVYMDAGPNQNVLELYPKMIFLKICYMPNWKKPQIQGHSWLLMLPLICLFFSMSLRKLCYQKQLSLLFQFGLEEPVQKTWANRNLYLTVRLTNLHLNHMRVFIMNQVLNKCQLGEVRQHLKRFEYKCLNNWGADRETIN